MGRDRTGSDRIGRDRIGFYTYLGEKVFKHITFTIRSLTQHVPHNAQLADPSNRYTVAMKRLTSKHASKKTEQDFKELDDLEWEGSLYLDDQQRVIVPGTVIEGALFEAGKTKRQGPTVRAGIYSNGDWLLVYDGPKSLAALKADPKFRWRVCVKNPSTGARLMRTRPRFAEWSLTFTVSYDPSIISGRDVVELVKILGSKIGLSDDRHKMGGRFDVMKVEGDVGDEAESNGEIDEPDILPNSTATGPRRGTARRSLA
jgi:hypothetical protein